MKSIIKDRTALFEVERCDRVTTFHEKKSL